MTRIDPQSLAIGKEPLRTVVRHRLWAGKTWFDIRLIPVRPEHPRRARITPELGEDEAQLRALES
jgi:hypothetical protein